MALKIVLKHETGEPKIKNCDDIQHSYLFDIYIYLYIYMVFFLIFAPKHRLGVQVRTAKIKTIMYTLHSPYLLYKMGCKGVLISRRCFPDGQLNYSCMN